MAGLMAGITKQMAIPYFLLNILHFFITFSITALFIYVREIKVIKIPMLDFLPSTYYIYNEGNKSTK